MPKVYVNGRSVEVAKGTPLDIAIRKAGFWGIYRSVKYGRIRDIADCSHIYPQYVCVEVKGRGLVNPLSFRVEEDVEVALKTHASAASVLSGKLPMFGVGFQNMWAIRGGLGWRLARRVILSSANLPSNTDMQAPAKLDVKSTETKVLVVGGGPAGLGVAGVLHEKGFEFTLVDQHDSLGGRLRYAIGQLKEALGINPEKLGGLGEHVVHGHFLGVYEEGVGLISCENSILKVRFDSLVYTTGSRCPPPLFAGNDSPRVVSVDYALRLHHYGLLEPPIVFYVEDEWGIMVYEALCRRLEIVLASPLGLEEKAASQILKVKNDGKRLTVFFDNGEKTPASLVVYSTVRQPSLELPAQAGFTYRLTGERIVCSECLEEAFPSKGQVWVAGSATGVYELAQAYEHGKALGWLLVGEPGLAEKLTPRPAKHPLHANLKARPEAFLCFCEDVKVGEFCSASSLGDAEKAKRSTGWGTGVCQGKLCLVNGLRLLGGAPYTQRTPVQPTPLALLATLGESNGA